MATPSWIGTSKFFSLLRLNGVVPVVPTSTSGINPHKTKVAARKFSHGMLLPAREKERDTREGEEKENDELLPEEPRRSPLLLSRAGVCRQQTLSHRMPTAKSSPHLSDLACGCHFFLHSNDSLLNEVAKGLVRWRWLRCGTLGHHSFRL